MDKMNFARNVFVILKLFTEDVLRALTTSSPPPRPLSVQPIPAVEIAFEQIRQQAKECYFSDRQEDAISMYKRLAVAGVPLTGEEHGYYGDLLH